MDKDFFATFEQRKKDFAERAGIQDPVRAEMVLTTGRIYVVETIVETADAWLHIDGRDTADEAIPVSLVLPYHQISHVLFVKPKVRMRQAGFAG